MLRGFIKDESAAITVDWVVLSAGIVGLGMATVGVVSMGIEDVSGDTAAQMTGIEIQTAFPTPSSLLSNDFGNGLGGWVGGTVENVLGFGEILQLGPNELAQTTFAVPEGSTSATISFDLLGVDDLSGESASIMINGQTVALYADDHGNITHTDSSGAGINVSVNQQYSNDPMGSGSHGSDSRATYTITIDNPGDSVTLGVQSNTGQPITEEFYAIDDVNFQAA